MNKLKWIWIWTIPFRHVAGERTTATTTTKKQTRRWINKTAQGLNVCHFYVIFVSFSPIDMHRHVCFCFCVVFFRLFAWRLRLIFIDGKTIDEKLLNGILRFFFVVVVWFSVSALNRFSRCVYQKTFFLRLKIEVRRQTTSNRRNRVVVPVARTYLYFSSSL